MPNPLAERRQLVVGLASQMLIREASDAEVYRAHQLRWWRADLRRHGLDDETIERELRALKLAVDAELWRLILLPPLTEGRQ
jgi:hypothetical protein